MGLHLKKSFIFFDEKEIDFYVSKSITFGVIFSSFQS